MNCEKKYNLKKQVMKKQLSYRFDLTSKSPTKKPGKKNCDLCAKYNTRHLLKFFSINITARTRFVKLIMQKLNYLSGCLYNKKINHFLIEEVGPVIAIMAQWKALLSTVDPSIGIFMFIIIDFRLFFSVMMSFSRF